MARYPVDRRIVIPGLIPFGGLDSAAKYGRHAGDDSANGIGTPVYAPASGRVTGYSWGVYHGNVIEIQDERGLFPHVFHLSSRLPSVQTNMQVAEGQLIGYTGATGQGITGPHIHFGVSKVSVPLTKSFSDYIDPMEYIKQGGDMPYNEDQFYRAFRTLFLRDPTLAEAQNTKFRDPIFLSETAWNNGGEANYKTVKQYPDVFTVGVPAIRDKWQQQIVGQGEQITALTKENEKLKAGEHIVTVDGVKYEKG